MQGGFLSYNREMITPRLIAENEFVLVFDKPAGLIVHSDGRTIEPSLADWILENYPALKDVGEPWLSPQGVWYPRPGIVHRLDRTTSGVIVLAKSQEAYTYLKAEFKARRVHKSYRAIVYGWLPEDEGEICAEILRSDVTPKKWYAQDVARDNSRAAITRYRVLSRSNTEAPITSVEAYPETGRTHQIRVHFAHIGYPLVSDHLYAPDRPQLLGITRPALHAHTIMLTLPNTDVVSFEAPVPKELLLTLSAPVT